MFALLQAASVAGSARPVFDELGDLPAGVNTVKSTVPLTLSIDTGFVSIDWEIATEPTFAAPVFSALAQPVGDLVIPSSTLVVGVYWARVRANYATGASIWDVRQILIGGPSLITSDRSITIPETGNWRFLASGAGAPGGYDQGGGGASGRIATATVALNAGDVLDCTVGQPAAAAEVFGDRHAVQSGASTVAVQGGATVLTADGGLSGGSNTYTPNGADGENAGGGGYTTFGGGGTNGGPATGAGAGTSDGGGAYATKLASITGLSLTPGAGGVGAPSSGGGGGGFLVDGLGPPTHDTSGGLNGQGYGAGGGGGNGNDPRQGRPGAIGAIIVEKVS